MPVYDPQNDETGEGACPSKGTTSSKEPCGLSVSSIKSIDKRHLFLRSIIFEIEVITAEKMMIAMKLNNEEKTAEAIVWWQSWIWK